MHGKTHKYEGMRHTYSYAAMIYPVKYRYLSFQLFSLLHMPHIQRYNWIEKTI